MITETGQMDECFVY